VSTVRTRFASPFTDIWRGRPRNREPDHGCTVVEDGLRPGMLGRTSRSASWMTTISPVASLTPRAMARLPPFCGRWSTMRLWIVVD
jgi:hypothetical protein